MNTKVSIVYLTKNGGPLFRESLKAVFTQKPTFNFEVVAIDSGSTDGTLALLKEYPVRVFHILPYEFNFGITRDYGFSVCRGEIVIALSTDVIPVGTDWLSDIVAPFDDPNIAAVQGIDVLPPSDNLFYWEKVGLFYFTRECRAWIERHDGIGMSFTSCAIRRQVWEENRMGAVEMAEDKVFQKKLWEKGYKIYFQRKARDYHTHVYDVISLAKRCRNEGLGWRNVEQIYTFHDMVADMCNLRVLRVLYDGVINFKITRIAEMLFPFIRPLYIFIGNHFTKKYIR